MRSRRPRTAATLVVLGLLLLASVAVGQLLGDRALFGQTEHRSPVAQILPTPVPEESGDLEAVRNWKRLQVVSVATDPAFPDPRVTPPPTATPRPPPTPRPADFEPVPGQPPLPGQPAANPTLPPTPAPLVTNILESPEYAPGRY